MRDIHIRNIPDHIYFVVENLVLRARSEAVGSTLSNLSKVSGVREMPRLRLGLPFNRQE